MTMTNKPSDSWNWAKPGENLTGKAKPLAACSAIIVTRNGKKYRYHEGYSVFGVTVVPPSYWPADHGDGPEVFAGKPPPQEDDEYYRRNNT